jgi:hypothetical protein
VIDRLRSALATLVFLGACSASPDATGLAAAPTIDTLPNGAVRIVNHGPTEWSDTNGWKLVLDYTVESAAGTPGELIQPMGLSIHPDGRLLVGDHDPVQLKLYGPRGEFVQAIGRDGDGPGEYRSANPLWLGDTIFVQDTRGSGRGVVFTSEGQAVTTFPAVCCMAGTPPATNANHHIRILGMGPQKPGEFSLQWVWFSTTGERLDSFPPPELGKRATWQIDQGGGGVATYGVPFAGYTHGIPLRDGTNVFGFTTNYEFVVARRNADTVRIIANDGAESVPISDSLRQATLDQFTTRPGYVSGASIDGIPAHFPYWRDLSEDGEGNLWVGRLGPSGMVEWYDVFSIEGRLRGAVPTPWRGVWQTSWGGDRVAVLDIDENELPRIRVYRIER